MGTKIRLIKLKRKQKKQLDAYMGGWEYGQLSDVPTPKLTKKQSKAMPTYIDGIYFDEYEKMCFLDSGHSNAFGEVKGFEGCCITYQINAKGWLIRERWYSDKDVKTDYVFTSQVKF